MNSQGNGSILDDRLLSRRDVAELLGIRTQTLGVWGMTGRNLPVVKVGRRVRYRLSDVEAFVRRQTRPASQ